jgi:RHS repeat-associated protein
LTGAGGAVLNTYSYLPFGETLSSTVSASNPFTYVGQEGVMNSSSGLYYMRNRWYDPGTGRLTQPDPAGLAGGSTNLYTYAANSPTSLIDPTGLDYQRSLTVGLAFYVGVNAGVTWSDAGWGVTYGHSEGYQVGAGITYSGSNVSASEGWSPQTSQSILIGAWQSNDGSNRAADNYTGMKNSEPGAYSGWSVGLPVSVGLATGQQNTYLIPHPQSLNDALSPQGQDAYNSMVSWYKTTNGSASREQFTNDADYYREMYNYWRAYNNLDVNNTNTNVKKSVDPNGIIGPAAYGASSFVNANSILPYTIDFQNSPTATASVGQIQITQQLDPNLDWSTFQFGDIELGNLDIPIPAGMSSINETLDERSTLGVYVQVVAGIDDNTGLATWTLTALDPNTMQIPADPLLGLLPPDTSPPEGDGSVSYTIQPKASDTTGTIINAQASIVFDVNAPIATSQISDTLDARPPTSSVNALPTYSPATFTVSWTGQDDPGGSAIAAYNVYVSDNGGDYTLWQDNTTATSALFAGQNGHTYTFGVTTVDNVGNQQTLASAAVSTTVDAVPPATSTAIAGPAGTNGWYTGSVQVTLSATDAISGVASTKYKVDGGSLQTYTSGSPFTVSGDGAHTVTFYSTDNAGNQESKETATIRIDGTKPATTDGLSGTTGTNGWYTGSVQVTLSATDATSGVASTEYRVDGGSLQTYTSGTPFTVSGDGAHTVTFYSIDNAGNQEVNQTTTIEIDEASSITSAAGASFTVGKVGNFTVTTTGYPAATLNETGTLPRGVTFVDNGDGTAALSGTPAATTGDYVFDITADNPEFPPIAQTFTLAVTDPPIITSATGTTFTVGKAGKFTITTTPGLPATTTLSESGKLPSGVTFKAGSNGTATLSGTPVAGSGGLYTLTIRAGNAASSLATQTFTLTVNQAPSFTSAASATFDVGQLGSFTVKTTGYPAAAFTWGTGSPSWCTWSAPSNGTITMSGTPATTGSYSFTIQAANGLSPAATQHFTLTVDQAPAITIPTSAPFIVGQKGSITITTVPGLPTTTTLSEIGKLPSGVTFKAGSNGTATLSGTPAAGSGGAYPITITAGNAPGSTATQPYTLYVDQAPAITSAAGATFDAGQLGSFTVKTTGYPAATFTWGAGSPSWCTWSAPSSGTITMSGTPTVTGSYSFTIQAANGLSPAATQHFTLTVDQAPAITIPTSAPFIVGQKGSITITAANGTPAATPKFVESGKLPGGVRFKDNGNGTATLSGTPAAGTGGAYPITITAGNAPGSTATQPYTLYVDQAPAITSAAGATFDVGQLGSFAVKTTGYPAAALSESGTLPAGVTFLDNGNGTATLSGTPFALSGTPPAAVAGTYHFTIKAGKSASAPSQNFTLTVDQAPIITSANRDTFTIGQAGSFTVVTTGFPAATLSESGKLPSGVTFKAGKDGTAILSGKPSAMDTVGPYTFTITAGNGVSPEAFQLFTLTVAAATKSEPPTGTDLLDAAAHDAATMGVLGDSDGDTTSDTVAVTVANQSPTAAAISAASAVERAKKTLFASVADWSSE